MVSPAPVTWRTTAESNLQPWLHLITACLFVVNPPVSPRKAAYLPVQIDCTNTAVLFWRGHLIAIRQMLGMTQWWFKERTHSQSAIVSFYKERRKSLEKYSYVFLEIEGFHLKHYKTITRCGLNPPEFSLWVSNKWADNKMTQLSICHGINKMFDLLHLLCEWRRSGKSPLVNPQSFCSSALTWIYRFVWVFRSAAWVSKFTLMGI